MGIPGRLLIVSSPSIAAIIAAVIAAVISLNPTRHGYHVKPESTRTNGKRGGTSTVVPAGAGGVGAARSVQPARRASKRSQTRAVCVRPPRRPPHPNSGQAKQGGWYYEYRRRKFEDRRAH